MRDHTTPTIQELTSTGSESASVTPGAAQVSSVFNIAGLDPVNALGHRMYAQAFWLHMTTTFDPDAAGSAVNHDKLPKVLASGRLFSPLLGEYFPAKMTRGPVLYHIIGVLASGYQYPQGARTQIPASTDTDVTIDLYFKFPLANEYLKKPHETSFWVGLFDQGALEASCEISTALDGDYAGAVLKTPTTFRAWVVTQASPDIYLGCPVQWRDREVTGGGTQPTLLNVGQETQLTGVKSGCGLAWLSWLTNATGIGMGGPDGTDNLTQVELPWRGQKNVRNLDPFFVALREAAGKRVGPISGIAAAVHDGGGWPFTMADTPSNRLAASAQSMFLPSCSLGWMPRRASFSGWPAI